MSGRIRRLVVRLSAAMLLTTALAGAMIAHAQETVQVTLTEWEIQPSAITVAVGETVRFAITNPGNAPHDLHIEGPGFSGEALPAANLASGESTTWEVTFTQAGTYTMWCPVGNHRERGMEGTLVVTVAGVQAAPVQTAPAQAPRALPRTGDAADAGEPAATAIFAAGAVLAVAGWRLRGRGAVL